MAANTITLIIVVAAAALLLAGIFAIVVRKTRIKERGTEVQTVREEAEVSVLRELRREALDNHDPAVAYAAQKEVELRTPRICRARRKRPSTTVTTPN